MAISLASVKKTAPRANPFVLLYGPAKVGKTTLASEAPHPIMIQTPGENPPVDVEVDTFGEASTLDEFFDAIDALLTDDHTYQTFIIDSADGVERMVNEAACKRNGWQSIEEPGFGKGHVEAVNIWTGEVLKALTALREVKGMNIIMISHVEIVKFDSPTSDSYNRYRPNLRKSVADVVQDGADIIGFINHRVSIVKEKQGGFGGETKRGEGAGLRIIYLDERPGFIAGNRYKMPPEMTLKEGKGWAEIAKYLPGGAA